MCGFIACIGTCSNTSHRFPQALSTIACRGPDASATAQTNQALFGHTRLAIIGLGADGQQPVQRDGKLLAFNGEIYNYRELAQQLNCEAKSDVNVLFEMCRRGIDPWISKIRGMYAFVYFDSTTEEVIAARDPFGIKPLYYSSCDSRGVLFGSTVAALKELIPSRSLDEVSLVHFLASGLMARHRTAYREIRELPPGQFWRWRRNQDEWKLDRKEETSFGAWPSLSVEQSVQDSVEAHLVADVEVGVLLSGGIDSTLLAAMASKSGRQVRTFSLTNPENPEIDEAAIAQHNAEVMGAIHTEVPVSPRILAGHIRPLIQSIGEPFSDDAYLPLSALSHEVRKHVKVVLAGEGADELFGGYRRYDAERWMRGFWFNNVVHPIARISRLDERFLEATSNSKRVLAASAMGEEAGRHAALMYAAWQPVLRALPELGAEAWLNYLETWEQSQHGPWALNLPPNRAFDLRVWLPEVFLQKSDRASMLHGLEVRTPYLDPVIAQAARLIKTRNSSKQVLRSALMRELPGLALPKRKKGLDVDLRALMRQGILGESTTESPLRLSLVLALGVTEPQVLQRALGQSPQLSFRHALMEIWYREFF